VITRNLYQCMQELVSVRCAVCSRHVLRDSFPSVVSAVAELQVYMYGKRNSESEMQTSRKDVEEGGGMLSDK
jgi:hypothetical protein